jgi:hypothetical protein
MHERHTPPPANLRVIGHTPGHRPLHAWDEGLRSFEERYERFTAASGTKYGVSVVHEVTAERRLTALQSNQIA